MNAHDLWPSTFGPPPKGLDNVMHIAPAPAEILAELARLRAALRDLARQRRASDRLAARLAEREDALCREIVRLESLARATVFHPRADDEARHNG